MVWVYEIRIVFQVIGIFFPFSIVVGNKRSAEQLLTRVMRGNDFLIRALRSQMKNPVSHNISN